MITGRLLYFVDANHIFYQFLEINCPIYCRCVFNEEILNVVFIVWLSLINFIIVRDLVRVNA